MNTEIREYDKNVQFEIGQRIQKMRIKEGLKSIDLATELGITKNQMSRIEMVELIAQFHNYILLHRY